MLTNILIFPCKTSWQTPNEKGYYSLNKNVHGYSRLHRKVYAKHHNITLTTEDYICHHCDNPGCIEITHLFLGTQKDNMHDMASKGRRAKGEHNGNSSLTKSAVLRIREMHQLGYTQSEIAIEFKVTRPLISYVVNRKVWGYI